MSNYQQRNFLLLGDTQETKTSRKMLRSPLGLAEELIVGLFENNVDSLVKNLDDIKGFVAGITSSKKFASDYPLAEYYPSFFAYHQYFHSSFRARQGKTLEEIVLAMLTENFHCEDYGGQAKNRVKLLSELLGFKTLMDMDAVGWNQSKKKLAMIQIRSRDDTGGTTAKASLVDYAREMLRNNATDKQDVLYIVSVWDDSRSTQKQSLITKCYLSLKDLIPGISEDEFTKNFPKGIILKDKLKLILTYGQKELIYALCDWFGENKNDMGGLIEKAIKSIENWDDLWISYLIANMEIEQRKLTGKNNIEIINKLMADNNIKLDYSNNFNLIKSIDGATTMLIPLWKDSTIRLTSPAHQSYYIRDLLYLKACYHRIKTKHV